MDEAEREKWRKYKREWMARYRKEHPAPKKGPHIHPTTRRMDAEADAIWERYKDPTYYQPAAERFIGHIAMAVDCIRTIPA